MDRQIQNNAVRQRMRERHILRQQHVQHVTGMQTHAARITVAKGHNERRTPKGFLELVRQVIGPIMLDPCGHPESYVDSLMVYSGPKHNGKDGLTLSWRGFGAVFANPEYGSELKTKWIPKVMEMFGSFHKKSHPPIARGDQLILLTAARIGTKWLQDHLLEGATALCFLDERLYFDDLEDPAAFDSLVSYFGAKPDKFINVFKTRGWTLDQVTGRQYRKGVEI